MIKVSDLSFTYAGTQKPAVQNVSFEIGRGQIFGFLGPSGAGKSTTQKVLIGLLRDYVGTVSVMGTDLEQRTSDYYERVGVSFELPNHYLKLTAVENLTYFRSLYNVATREPQELLEMVGLGESGNTFVSQFSKGMKNRLSVARSLLNNPDILFMDEPTAGLDPLNAQRIKEIIRDQQQAGKTIFLTTHDMAVADQLCDQIAFIVDGKIGHIESPRELKLQHGQQAVRVEYGKNGSSAYKTFPLPNLGHNPDFLTLLKNGDVQTIHTQEATLEDVFIKVTGRSLT